MPFLESLGVLIMPFLESLGLPTFLFGIPRDLYYCIRFLESLGLPIIPFSDDQSIDRSLSMSTCVRPRKMMNAGGGP